MFVAHLPAGYLLWRATGRRLNRPLLLTGAIAPDVDLVAVYVFGVAQHHHDFLTHTPAIWMLVLLVLPSLGIGALLHLGLDSVAGRINWGWPLAEWRVTLVQVPDRFEPWHLNFLLHGTFAVELAICTLAIWLYRTPPKEKPRR